MFLKIIGSTILYKKVYLPIKTPILPTKMPILPTEYTNAYFWGCVAPPLPHGTGPGFP